MYLRSGLATLSLMKQADSDQWIGDDVLELEGGLGNPRREPLVWPLAVAANELGGEHALGLALPDCEQEVAASPGSVDGWGRGRA